MFSSVRERFISFADDQRRERLDQCVEIQLALNECLRVAARKERKEQEQQQKKQSNSNTSRWNKFSRSNENKVDSNNNNNNQIHNGDVNDNNNGSDEPKMKLEDTKAGMRISRFYGWGLVNPRAQAAIAEMRENSNEWQSMGQPTSNSNTSSNSVSKVVNENSISNGDDATKTAMNDTKFSTTSSIEPNNKPSSTTSTTSHSVHCTRETHALYACKALALGCGSDLMKMKNCFVEQLGTTNPSSIHYDSNDGGGGESSLSSSSTKCHLEQRKVGDCIRKNMNELNERLEKRSS